MLATERVPLAARVAEAILGCPVALFSGLLLGEPPCPPELVFGGRSVECGR